MDTLETILKSYKFQFSLKPEQRDIIEGVVNNKDVFGLLPTGFGKSMTYTLIPLLFDQLHPDQKHTAIVVSPLKALMRDQVSLLLEHSIQAAAIIEDTSVKDKKKWWILESVYCLPHQKQQYYRNDSSCGGRNCRVKGQAFRPTYREEAIIQSYFDTPNLALTATATKTIQQDIYIVLGLDANHTKVISELPDRTNIFLDIQHSTEKFEEELSWLLERLRNGRQDKKFIIYFRSINNCYKLFLWLMTQLLDSGFSGRPAAASRRVEMFHANTDQDSKERIIEQFVKPDGNIEVLICTVAFGMGVNIPNVDMVIHWGLLSSSLQYWQEVGRCARDGRKGYALCYGYKRSVTKCEDEQLKKTSSHEYCIRYNILENFQLEGMPASALEALKTATVCTEKCDICRCKKCSCCVYCKSGCTCIGRKISIENFLSS